MMFAPFDWDSAGLEFFGPFLLGVAVCLVAAGFIHWLLAGGGNSS